MADIYKADSREEEREINPEILSKLNGVAKLAMMNGGMLAFVIDDHLEQSQLFAIYAKHMGGVTTVDVGSERVQHRSDLRLPFDINLINTIDQWLKNLKTEYPELKVLMMLDLNINGMAEIIGVKNGAEMIMRLSSTVRETDNNKVKVYAWSSNGDEVGLSTTLGLPRSAVVKKEALDGLDRVLREALGIQIEG